MRNIRDKIAVVTGAGSGIGRAIALRLAQEGARLFLVDLNAASCELTAQQVHAAGGEAAIWSGDLADRAAIEQLATAALLRFGTVDILVNNAGIGWYGPTALMSDEAWDRLLAVNLEAPIWLTRRLLKTLLSRDEAHVINMASICGWVCGGRFAAYHVSKFGLVGFSEAMRAEFQRQGLGVTAVCPGPVRTDLYRASGCGHATRTTPEPPAWLCTTPERVAAATVRAIYRNQAIAVVGATAKLLYYGKRLMPTLFYGLHGVGRAKLRKQKLAADQGKCPRPLPKAA